MFGGPSKLPNSYELMRESLKQQTEQLGKGGRLHAMLSEKLKENSNLATGPGGGKSSKKRQKSGMRNAANRILISGSQTIESPSKQIKQVYSNGSPGKSHSAVPSKRRVQVVSRTRPPLEPMMLI